MKRYPRTMIITLISLMIVYVSSFSLSELAGQASDVSRLLPVGTMLAAEVNTGAAMQPAEGCGASFAQPAGSPVGAGTSPFSAAVGDFNLDGNPDLAVANTDSHNVTILLGNGIGGFTQPAGSPVGTGLFPRSVAVGDFNLDGNPDLAVTSFTSNNVTVLLGNGIGGFNPHTGSPFGVGSGPHSVTVGDFNLDSKPDLAVANYYSNDITILLRNGSGGFDEPAGSPVGAGANPISVSVADFNLNGKPDLAVANESDGVTILLGNGSGGFDEPDGSPISAGADPRTTAVGDFNLDGKPDLAVANGGDATVTILLGNGSGGFTKPVGPLVVAGGHPFSAAVADFNLDDKPDLAVANGGNVTILLGDGSGGFTQPTGSPVGAGSVPLSVVAGDFNLDGKPDFAVANEVSNNVTIQINTCTSNRPPVAICHDVTVNAGSDCKADASINNGSSDPDGDTITLDQSPAGPYPKGTTTVTLTVNDGNGNTSTCTATVIVVDNVAPVAKCKNATVFLNANGSASISLANIENGSTDNCGIASHVLSKTSFDCSNLGANSVTLTVTDTSGNTNTCTATVIVVDPISPTITCPANVTAVAQGPGTLAVAANFASPTIGDNCSGATILCSPQSGSAFPVGTTTVTCTVKDTSNNQASCQFTVTVFDVRLQNDNGFGVLLWSSVSGVYRYCCEGAVYTGTGVVVRKGNQFTLTHSAGDRRLNASVDASGGKGTASLQSPPGTIRCLITDKDIRNNTSLCP